MNFPGNFFHIGNIDLSELEDLDLNLTEEQWDSFSLRQKPSANDGSPQACMETVRMNIPCTCYPEAE